VLPGDLIKTTVKRKIKLEYGLGMVKTEIRHITLTMQVKKIDYEVDQTAEIFIKAINFEENQYVQKGQYQNFKINSDDFQKLTVIKEKWNKYHWKIITEIRNPELSSDVAALIMDEGVAHLCFVQ